MPTPKIIYWDLFFNNGVDVTQDNIQKQLGRLLNGELGVVQFEKLKGRNKIYSIRLNGASRLIFTECKIGQQNCLILLEYLPNHEYESSKFLNNPTLVERVCHNLQEQEDVFEGRVFEFIEISEIDFFSRKENEHEATASATASTPYEFTPRRATFVHSKFILLNQTQEEIAKQYAGGIIIVDGVAGSGKTSVSFSLIQNAINSMPVDTTRKILYVVKSKRLVSFVQKTCQPVVDFLNESFSEDGKWTVEYKTFNALFEDSYEGRKLVGKEDFCEWFNSRHAKKNLKVEDYYNECCVIASFGGDKNKYLKVGAMRSLLPTTERSNTFNIYSAYTDSLKNRNEIDPALFACDFHQQYGLVIVDECQDFYPCEIECLYCLSGQNRHNLVMCGDINQSLKPNSIIIDTYVCDLSDKKEEVKHISLKYTYRCSSQIAEFATRILTVKSNVFGGVVSKGVGMSVPCLENREEGLVRFFRRNDDYLNFLIEAYNSLPFLVVVDDDIQIELAEQILGENAIVLNVEVIKGLEFERVIYFNPLASANKNTIDAIGAIDYSNVKSMAHQPKDKTDTTRNEYLLPFNKMFVAATRAIHELIIIIYNDRPECSNFFSFLENGSMQHRAETVKAKHPVAFVPEFAAISENLAQKLCLAAANEEDNGNAATLQVAAEKARRISEKNLRKKTVEKEQLAEEKTEEERKLKTAAKKADLKKTMNFSSKPKKLIVSIPERIAAFRELFTKYKKNTASFRAIMENLFSATYMSEILFNKDDPLIEFLFHLDASEYFKNYLLNKFNQKLKSLQKEELQNLVNSLFYMPKQTEQKFLNNSAFFLLCGSEQGINFLIEISKINPDFLNSIPSEILYTLHEFKLENIVHTNVSAFSLLCSHKQGLEFLNNVFTFNPGFLNLIDKKILSALTKQYVKDASVFLEDDENISAFSFLCGHHEGIIFLTEKHPFLLNYVTKEALYSVIRPSLNEEDNEESKIFSIFQLLCTSENGVILLRNLFRCNPSLLEALTVETLNKKMPKSKVSYFLSSEKRIKNFNKNKRL